MVETLNIVDPQRAYSLTLPRTTPQGQSVDVQRGERGDLHVLHAESPDQSELYFEVAAYSGLLDHVTLATEQQRFLRKNAADAQTTDIVRSPGVHAGTSFDFRGTLQGRWKVRRFLFVDGPTRTYRIVRDPTSDVNERILLSLNLGSRDG